MSCFMLANSRSSASVHALEGDSRGGSISSGGRRRNERVGEVPGLGVRVTVEVSGFWMLSKWVQVGLHLW